LFHSQFTTSVRIVREVYFAERAVAEHLAFPPVGRGFGSCAKDQVSSCHGLNVAIFKKAFFP